MIPNSSDSWSYGSKQGISMDAVRSRRFTLLASLILPVFCLPSTAQQPSEPTPTPFRIEVNVNRVPIPVIVRDKQGNAITDLKKEDFEVFDEGKPHPISGFSVQRHEATPPNTKIVPPTPPANTSQADAPVIFPDRITVFLFDDLHLSIEDLAHAREAGVKVLGGAITGTDMAAVVSVSGRVNTGLTRDLAKLQDAIKSLVPRNIAATEALECPSIDYYEADLIENKRDAVAIQDANQKFANCNPSSGRPRDLDSGTLPRAENLVAAAAQHALNLGHQDVQNTYAAIAAFISRLAPLPGQRTLILVSPGVLNVERDAVGWESRIINLAVQSNVTISALDARGLYTTTLNASEKSPSLRGNSLQTNTEYHGNALKIAENSMAELADGTGGNFFHNNNDLVAGLKQLTDYPSCTYVLELSLDGVKHDGTFHRLKVKVNRAAPQIQARRGYFVPKPDKNKH